MINVATMPNPGLYSFYAPKTSYANLPALVRRTIGSSAEASLSVVKSDSNIQPVVIREITYRGRTFCFNPYLELFPAYDETGELLCLEYKPLGIHVFAGSRNELYDELAEQVSMLWDEYVCEDDNNLTLAAIQLKKNLLGTLEKD